MLIFSVVFAAILLCVWGVAVFPLHRSKAEPIQLSDIPISISLGALVAGLVYVLFLRLGVDADRGILISSIVAALFGITRLRGRLRLSSESLSGWGWFWNSLIFVCLSGLTVGASFQMGMGVYPPIFVNDDSSLRLAHSFSVLNSLEYPPESLFVSGTVHAYHYGAPASAAAIASVSGLPPHKAMFWVLCPVLMLGIFSLIYQVTRKLLGDSWRQRLSITLFMPYVMLGSMAFSLVNSDISYTLIGLAETGWFWSEQYDGGSFGNGVWDVSMLSGLFLLLLAVHTATRAVGSIRYALPLLIAALTLFCKLDVAPAVFIVLGVTIIMGVQKENLKLSTGTIFGIFLTPVIFYFLFGYGEGQSEAAMVNVRTLDQAMSFFDWRWTRARPFLTEICWVVLASVLCLADEIRFGNWKSSRITLVLSVAVAVVGSYLTIAVIFVPKTGVQFSLAMWIGVAFIGTALLANRTRVFQWVGTMMLLPVFLVAEVGQVTRLAHAVVVVAFPSQAEEYSDNQYIGDAMSAIFPEQKAGSVAFGRYVDKYADLAEAFEQDDNGLSKEEWGERHYAVWGKAEGRILDERPEVIVVTNDFRYSKWDDTQPQISAMFGHTTFSTHPRLFPGPNGYNVEAAKRIDVQRTSLSRQFSKDFPSFVQETLSIAVSEGWTHYLMRKDLDDGLPPVDSDSVPLLKIFENSRYVVYEFSTF